MRSLLVISVIFIVFGHLDALGFSLDKTIDYDFYQKFQHGKYCEISRNNKCGISPFSALKQLIADGTKLYEASANPFLQNFIDETVMTIIFTKTGGKFCQLVGTNTQAISYQLGTSLETSNIISLRCEEVLGKKVDKAPENVKKRRYLFATSKSVDFPLDSWSTVFKDTIIFIDQLLAPIEIFRRIIHELYISYDIRLLVARDVFDYVHSDYKNDDGSFKSYDTYKKIKVLMLLMDLPTYEYAFSVMRAIKLEESIYKDLKNESITVDDDSVYLEKWKQGECWEIFRIVTKSLLPYQKYLIPAKYLGLPDELQLKLSANRIINGDGEHIVENMINLINEFDVTFEDKRINGKINFCEYMSLPMMEDNFIFFSRGPRPRIKSGWGGSNQSFRTSNLENIDHSLLRRKELKELRFKTKVQEPDKKSRIEKWLEEKRKRLMDKYQ